MSPNPHSEPALHADTWDLPTSTRLAPYLNWGKVLADLGEENPEIVVLTADLSHANRLTDFARVHPGRFFNFGIGEKNMVSAAAGLAAAGLLPYVATYASFVGLLCAEQIRTDVCYTEMPVRILAHHSGIAMGFYGSSHHATEDLAIMRSFAGLTVFGTVDPFLAEAALKASVNHSGPIYFRLGRGREKPVYDHPPADFAFGRAITVRQGKSGSQDGGGIGGSRLPRRGTGPIGARGRPAHGQADRRGNCAGRGGHRHRAHRGRA
jgi:transketolase